MSWSKQNTARVPRAEVLVPNPKLRLREQVREVMRFKHYAVRTEEAYWHWIRRFLKFHRKTEKHFDTSPNPLPDRGGEGAARRHADGDSRRQPDGDSRSSSLQGSADSTAGLVLPAPDFVADMVKETTYLTGTHQIA